MNPSLLDRVQAPIRHALFDPKVTGPLLIALIYYPEKLRSILPAQIHSLFNSLISSRKLLLALKALLGLGLIRKANNKLSSLVVNNWKSDAKFAKSQELVLITGGSSGIGELMARDFAKKGVKVIVLDLNPSKKALPSNVHYYRGDVTKSSEIASVAAEIRKDHGEPTVLINNAGIGSCQTILGGSEAMIRKTFEVNTIAHFLMAREFLPAMIKKNHGHIVTIASMASFIVHAQNVDYCCTKAGALAFHEGLASELRSRYNAPNVRTTVVHPAWIRTPLIEPLIAQPEFTDPVLEPEDVTAPIIKQVMDGKSGQLILPKELNSVSTLRAWPSWLQTGLRNKVAHVLDFPDKEVATLQREASAAAAAS